MTAEEETLGQVVGMLDNADIAYMVTGSIATSYHGRPRATHDADVVIDPSPEQLEALLRDPPDLSIPLVPAHAMFLA